MKSLIFLILCITVAEVISKKALIFNLKSRALTDVCCDNGDQKYPACLTACPAFTPHEQQFNKNMSFSKESVFSRIINAKDKYTKNNADFCEKTVNPVMLFNVENNEYEIGYELYFEEKKFNNMTETTYHVYKPVNTKDLDEYEILNFTIPLNDSLVVRYEEDKVMKFNFTDGSRILVFYWINVLCVQSSKDQKRIKILYDGDFGKKKIKNLQDQCKNYPSDDEDLYSKINQKTSLKDIPVSPSFDRTDTDVDCGKCGHPYGCLEKSQVIPLWFFKSSLARRASCSHMNVIPVWGNVAKQIKKVDLYIVAVLEHLPVHSDVIYGVSGTLKILPTSSAAPDAPQEQRKIYLRSPESKNRKLPIPRIIYRIVTISLNNYEYNAVIVIHNDVTVDPEIDMLCINNTLSGWDRISNNNSRNGLTYVCPMTAELNTEFGAFDNLSFYDIKPLNLNSIPGRGQDETDNINKYFDDLILEFHNARISSVRSLFTNTTSTLPEKSTQ